MIISRVNVGPASLRYVDAGFSWVNADRIWNAIDSHIYGFTLQELKFPFQLEDYSDTSKSGLLLIPTEH